MPGLDLKDRIGRFLLLATSLCAFVACDSTSYVTDRAISVGERLLQAGTSGGATELSANRTFPDVVWIGPELARKLDALASLETSACAATVLGGDVHEDHEASHHLILNCHGFARLGIRLRFDRTLDKFHILGFWTPPEARQRASD